MNNTKWDELRLAMYDLGHEAPRFRVKAIGADQPGPWDGEWYYHFREGGYHKIERVELQLRDSSHRGAVARALVTINVPGVQTDAGFVVYGHIPPGASAEYIRT